MNMDHKLARQILSRLRDDIEMVEPNYDGCKLLSGYAYLNMNTYNIIYNINKDTIVKPFTVFKNASRLISAAGGDVAGLMRVLCALEYQQFHISNDDLRHILLGMFP